MPATLTNPATLTDPATLTNPASVDRSSEQRPAAVTISNLTKRYGKHTVVDDVSFEIPTGSVVGLLGPNGAGKTTVMKALLGLVKATSGDIRLLDTTVGARGWGATLHRVGSMIEAPALYTAMSARQNLQYQATAIGLQNPDQRIAEVLDLVGLADRADDKPRGYSLGMKQRLGIAVSLVGQPELIILDEPANGLDPHGIIEIRNLMRRLPDLGVTVLVSSHQLAEVQQACDTVVILSNGRVIEAGTTEQILSRHGRNTVDVRVVESDLGRAAVALNDRGLITTAAGADLLHVTGTPLPTGRQVNEILVAAGVIAEGVAVAHSSLEEAFVDLTDPGSELAAASR